MPNCKPATEILPFQSSASAQGTLSIVEPTKGLRSLAEKKNLWIGTAVPSAIVSDPIHSELLANEFNLLTPENAMKWEVIHPHENNYDFSQADLLVDFALKHGMVVRGHVLVWDMQMPGWVTEAEHTRDEWVQILCQHIHTVVGHYRGVVSAWDVVNEAVNDDGTLRNTFWMRKIGPEHIPYAFHWAHEADPEAVLFYNDNGGEGLNIKSQSIYQLIQGLQRSGVPIQGVGLQMHTAIDLFPSTENLERNMRRLAALGLEIHITEMDVRLQLSDKTETEKLAAQAETYQQVMSACLSNDKCSAFIVWGLTDRFSWIPGWTGQPDAPLLFDENGHPKPSYLAIHELLAQP